MREQIILNVKRGGQIETDWSVANTTGIEREKWERFSHIINLLNDLFLFYLFDSSAVIGHRFSWIGCSFCYRDICSCSCRCPKRHKWIVYRWDHHNLLVVFLIRFAKTSDLLNYLWHKLSTDNAHCRSVARWVHSRSGIGCANAFIAVWFWWWRWWWMYV